MSRNKPGNTNEGNLVLFNSLVAGALPAGTPASKPTDVTPELPKRQERYEWGSEWLSPLNDYLFTEVW